MGGGRLQGVYLHGLAVVQASDNLAADPCGRLHCLCRRVPPETVVQAALRRADVTNDAIDRIGLDARFTSSIAFEPHATPALDQAPRSDTLESGVQ